MLTLTGHGDSRKAQSLLSTTHLPKVVQQYCRRSHDHDMRRWEVVVGHFTLNQNRVWLWNLALSGILDTYERPKVPDKPLEAVEERDAADSNSTSARILPAFDDAPCQTQRFYLRQFFGWISQFRSALQLWMLYTGPLTSVTMAKFWYWILILPFFHTSRAVRFPLGVMTEEVSTTRWAKYAHPTWISQSGRQSYYIPSSITIPSITRGTGEIKHRVTPISSTPSPVRHPFLYVRFDISHLGNCPIFNSFLLLPVFLYFTSSRAFHMPRVSRSHWQYLVTVLLLKYCCSVM
jgi:hypothetical protein